MKTVLQLTSMSMLVLMGLFLQQCQTEQKPPQVADNATTTSEVAVDPLAAPEAEQPIADKAEQPVATLEEKPIPPVQSNQQLRSEVIAHAATFLNRGIPYKAAGKDENGFDCSGFTAHVFSKFNVSFAGSSAMLAELGKAIALEDAQAGDLMFFIRPNDDTKRIFHVGIIEKNEKDADGKLVTTIVHSKNKVGPARDEIQNAHWWRDMTYFARDISELFPE